MTVNDIQRIPDSLKCRKIIYIPVTQCIHRFVMQKELIITKTCLYNFDPLKLHFYIAKLGFTGVYTIFLISAHKHSMFREEI